MNRNSLLRFSLILMLVIPFCAFDIHAEQGESFRIIPIPEREHGYSNFDSTVISSEKELDTFLGEKLRGQGMGWNDKEGFRMALSRANLDFEQEALVLLRHTEASGSVQINFLQPCVKGNRIIARIERKEPEIGTADMAYFCFALAVVKAEIAEVKLIIPDKETLVLSLGKEQ